jgi:hypothetical protein
VRGLAEILPPPPVRPVRVQVPAARLPSEVHRGAKLTRPQSDRADDAVAEWKRAIERTTPCPEVERPTVRVTR